MKDAYTSPHPQHHVRVGPKIDMAYVDVDLADGPPVVFLHGNPTSSYLWRDVLSYVAPLGRCLAPDLVGMGNSDRDWMGRYRFADHRRFLEAWFDAVLPDGEVVLIGHEWGAALLFDWARRHPGRVLGIAHMEAVLYPRHWTDLPGERGDGRGGFEALFAADSALLDGVLRPLPDSVLAAYRAPYTDSLSRLPTLMWQRELPIHGTPPDVAEIVRANAAWMGGSMIPKLFVNAQPGMLAVGRPREVCRAWPNQTEITVSARHFVPEDSPHVVGEALAAFVERLNLFIRPVEPARTEANRATYIT